MGSQRAGHNWGTFKKKIKQPQRFQSLYTEFVAILLLFHVLLFWPCSRWDLRSLTRDWTTPPALEGIILTTGPPGKPQFSSVPQSVQLFATPWTAARQASLSITNSRSHREEDFKSAVRQGIYKLEVPPSGGNEELPRPYTATRHLLGEETFNQKRKERKKIIMWGDGCVN